MLNNKEVKKVSDVAEELDVRLIAYSMIDILYKQNMINKATYERVQSQRKKENRHPQHFKCCMQE